MGKGQQRARAAQQQRAHQPTACTWAASPAAPRSLAAIIRQEELSQQQQSSDSSSMQRHKGRWAQLPTAAPVIPFKELERLCPYEEYHAREREYSVRQLNSVETDAEECCVCLEALEEYDELQTLSCGHQLHRECARIWLATKPSCPICQAEQHANTIELREAVNTTD